MNNADQLILQQLATTTPHSRTCKMCGGSFVIEADDIEFYKRMIVPCPTLCPSCRFMRKMAFRNERSLYKRKCDATGKDIISIYSPNKTVKVYNNEFWWSDNWEPMEYGMDYDSNRSFFEQMNELINKVPQFALIASNNENSDYTNYTKGIKDCYMSFVIYYGTEKCHYCYWVYNSKDSMDSYLLIDSENCYQCNDSKNCNTCFYSDMLEGCNNCFYSSQLRSCSNCILCNNLSNKEYYIKNQKVTKEEFENIKRNIKFTNLELGEYSKMKSSMIVKNLNMVNCEDSTSDYTSNSKNTYYCLSAHDMENCKYSWGEYGKNCYDLIGGTVENVYESNRSAWAQYTKFCNDVIESSFMEYVYSCYNSTNLFGCVGLRHKEYCILNKQYTKEEYEILVEKIKLNMLQRGEYGEFFPQNMSPFGYNETSGNDFFPITKEEAISKGFNWSDYDPDSSYLGIFHTPSEDINIYKDENKAKELLAGVLKCAVSGKPYKIIPQELAFYLQNNLPIPRKCPNQRFTERLRMRNPYKLWDRKCMKCGTDIKTSYSPERTEKVYCEKCYQEEVY